MSTSAVYWPHTLPFPFHTLHTSDVDDQERNIETAETFRRGSTLGVFMSLGATDLHHAPECTSSAASSSPPASSP